MTLSQYLLIGIASIIIISIICGISALEYPDLKKRQKASEQLIKLMRLPGQFRIIDYDNPIKEKAITIFDEYSGDVHEKAAYILETPVAKNLVDSLSEIMQHENLASVFKNIQELSHYDASNPVVLFYDNINALLDDYSLTCNKLDREDKNRKLDIKQKHIQDIINQNLGGE